MVGPLTKSRSVETSSANAVKAASLEPVIDDKPAKFDFSLSILKRLRLAQFIIVGLLVLNSFLLYQVLISVQTNHSNLNSSQENLNASTINSNVVAEPSKKIIDSFTKKKGIIEIGQSLSLSQNSIETTNKLNCKTSISSPLNNGCGFTILPYSFNIPSRGAILKSIQFVAQLPEEAKLKLDLKDYEKGTLTTEIGTLDTKNLSKKILLPNNFQPHAGI